MSEIISVKQGWYKHILFLPLVLLYIVSLSYFLYYENDLLGIWIGLMFWPTLFFILALIKTDRMRYYCTKCGSQLKKSRLLNNSKLKVTSVTSTTKTVKSTNPGVVMGRIGGSNAGGISFNTSTSHVPIVLGQISATVLCSDKKCRAKNRWNFKGEVQVWTDIESNQESYKVVSKIRLPKR